MVRAEDVYVLAGVLTYRGAWTYRDLATALHVSPSVTQRAIERARTAGLYLEHRREIHVANFAELSVHALRFVAPARLGQIVPGVRAAWAAEPMSRLIRESSGEPPPVWPTATGTIRGQALEPLHRSAPEAAANQRALSELLSILDSLRAGDMRVRSVAADALDGALSGLARGA